MALCARLIELRDVTFQYPGSQRVVLQDINMSIPVGSRIALVGSTGSGKTTMAHLLLGLFRPQQGELMLDGLSVSDEEMPAWQANCAFVPQQIRLLDASIRENVAFCEEPELIDDDRVWAALEAAQFAKSWVKCHMGFHDVWRKWNEIVGGTAAAFVLGTSVLQKGEIIGFG